MGDVFILVFKPFVEHDSQTASFHLPKYGTTCEMDISCQHVKLNGFTLISSSVLTKNFKLSLLSHYILPLCYKNHHVCLRALDGE